MNFQKVGLKIYFQSWRFYSGIRENLECGLSIYQNNVDRSDSLSWDNPTDFEWDKTIFSHFAADKTGLYDKK